MKTTTTDDGKNNEIKHFDYKKYIFCQYFMWLQILYALLKSQMVLIHMVRLCKSGGFQGGPIWLDCVTPRLG